MSNPIAKRLTERQCEVMQAMCRLGNSKEVAAELGLTRHKTVDMILLRATRRIGVKTRILALLEFDRAAREAP